MPELPEVEVVRQGLARHLPGRAILDVRADGKTLRRQVPLAAMRRYLPGSTISGVRRRAKYLLVDLDNGALLILHLGMTGKLGLFPESAPALPHDHVFWLLDNGCELRFNDVRRFGTVACFAPDEAAAEESIYFEAAGPEPFSPRFTPAYLKEKAAGSSRPVKTFIMDAGVVAGIGNIYANESLYLAGIRPTREVRTIGLKRWQKLVDSIRTVLEQAIACGGSTISDFFGADGERGYFQINFRVYGKKDETCPRCRQPIEHCRLGGRASFFCRSCQR